MENYKTKSHEGKRTYNLFFRLESTSWNFKVVFWSYFKWGCSEFSKYGQAECADFIVDKKLNVDNLFTHTWSLNQAEEAYKIFDKQSDGKGVIIP